MIKKVCLETAKALKNAGFRQEGINSYWNNYENPDIESKVCSEGYPKSAWAVSETYAAPTSDEILEELPYSLRFTESDYWLWVTKLKHGTYEVRYTDAFHRKVKRITQDESLPEALAQMWLFLRKEKLI